MTVEGFIAKWAGSEASERANKDSFLNELCGVLGVPMPDPVTGDADKDRYVFEKDATLINEGKKNSVGKIDLYKHGCFVLEGVIPIPMRSVGGVHRWSMSPFRAVHPALPRAVTSALRRLQMEPPGSHSATAAPWAWCAGRSRM